jgi:hypothetical protein
MSGIEVAVGCLFAWAVRKARRVAGRADTEVDRGLDAAMDHLHEVVSRKLGQDSALARLAEEAEEGREEPTGRTRQRLQLALEDAGEHDPDFAEALRQAVAQVQAASGPGGGGGHAVSGNTFSGPTALQVGDHNRQDNHFGPGA